MKFRSIVLILMLLLVPMVIAEHGEDHTDNLEDNFPSEINEEETLVQGDEVEGQDEEPDPQLEALQEKLNSLGSLLFEFDEKIQTSQCDTTNAKATYESTQKEYDDMQTKLSVGTDVPSLDAVASAISNVNSALDTLNCESASKVSEEIMKAYEAFDSANAHYLELVAEECIVTDLHDKVTEAQELIEAAEVAAAEDKITESEELVTQSIALSNEALAMEDCITNERSVVQCAGCFVDGECSPRGTINDKTYCGVERSFVDQKAEGEECTAYYECASGMCSEGICSSTVDEEAHVDAEEPETQAVKESALGRFFFWLSSLFN